MSFFSTISQNVFVAFLENLKVTHTRSFSDKYYGEHPNKYNLLGLSNMLTEYGIENTAIKVEKKEEAIKQLEEPFIAHIGGDFSVVTKITGEKIHFYWNGQKIISSIENFIDFWSGVALIAEPNENSIEPNYKHNRKNEIFRIGQKIILIILLLLVSSVAFIKNTIKPEFELIIELAINIVGIYIGYSLVLIQLKIHSSYGDKICSLFKKSDCNNVLESSASKLWGIISWSEIGLSYFISNTLIALAFPFLFPYSVLINICILPYSFWSIWYQKVKTKLWCPLCLIVQVLLWVLFLSHLMAGLIQIPPFNLFNIFVILNIYTIPLLILNQVIPKLTDTNKTIQITQRLNSLKSNKGVFHALTKSQPYYNVNKNTSKILFGDPNAPNLITVLTNPHCGPCSQMHIKIEGLLEKTNNKYCVQYIFSSFEEKLDTSNKFLIAAYLNNKAETTKQIFNQWFDNWKFKKEEIFKNFNYNFSDSVLMEEFTKHANWLEQTKLKATPTILFNGFLFHEEYKLEDLAHIEL